jgi:hypothetical protein
MINHTLTGIEPPPYQALFVSNGNFIRFAFFNGKPDKEQP